MQLSFCGGPTRLRDLRWFRSLPEKASTDYARGRVARAPFVTDEGEYSRSTRDLYIEHMESLQETNPTPTPLHLNNWMNQVRWALVLIVIGAVAAGGAACPLWMTLSQHGMSCCDRSNSPDQCPLSICQASSPYLASRASTSHAPLLQAPPVDTVLPVVLWTPSASADLVRRDDGAPPVSSGPLFLRFHSLLI